MNKVITIWGNSEFGCEIAYRIAKETELSVILVDMDLLAPKADLCLKVKKEPEKINEKRPSIDILIEWANRRYLNSEIMTKAAVQREELKNLYIITGSYNIENFEYYDEESIEEVIKKAKQSFNVTILLVNKYIYDAYTIIGLLKSDINIVAIEPSIANLREFNNYIIFLKEKQGLEPGKTKFIAYEYMPGLYVTEELKEITDYNYLGSVRFSKTRVECRCKNKCYAKSMEKLVEIDYLNIIEKLGLTPKLKINEKVKNWFKILRIKRGVFVNANSKDA